jgi:ferredoxin-NADP reductase
VAALRPGTRVAVEGPYGAFTKHVAPGRKVLLVGAGVGVTPIRAMLEDLEADADAVVIVRASRRQDLVLHDELRRLVDGRRAGQLHELVGRVRTSGCAPTWSSCSAPTSPNGRCFSVAPTAS